MKLSPNLQFTISPGRKRGKNGIKLDSGDINPSVRVEIDARYSRFYRVAVFFSRSLLGFGSGLCI